MTHFLNKADRFLGKRPKICGHAGYPGTNKIGDHAQSDTQIDCLMYTLSWTEESYSYQWWIQGVSRFLQKPPFEIDLNPGS